MKCSEQIDSLIKALIKAQGEFPALPKDSSAGAGKFSYKYLSLPALMDLVTPILGQNKLGITQPTRQADGGVCVETVLLHESGQWISGETFIPAGSGDNRASLAQAYGSGITYARRYGLLSLLGVVADDDDDAQTAGYPVQRTQSKSNYSETPKGSSDWDLINDLKSRTRDEKWDALGNAWERGTGITWPPMVKGLSNDHKAALQMILEKGPEYMPDLIPFQATSNASKA